MEEMIEVGEIFRQMPSRFQKWRIDRQLVFLFTIDGDQWTVFIGPETCDVLPGKAVENADCFLTTTTAIFVGTITGKHTPSMTDLLLGKIKTNNPFLLQDFRNCFET